MASLWDLLQDVTPTDKAVQVNSKHYLRRFAAPLASGEFVLDLGCGTGSSARLFEHANPSLNWVGVDIESSPEVNARGERTGLNLVVFDGVRLPFADNSISLVYSHQVLEHVRHPEPLLREVYRIMKPAATFCGSTSNLEPYHSFSLWNFTPYGFRVIVEDAGLVLRELRPSIDGPTIIERQYRGRPPELSRFFEETSPLNQEIIEWGMSTRRRPALVNSRMLHYCGQFAFAATKPAG